MSELTLHGRGLVPGQVVAEAVVSHQAINGWGAINAKTGVIIESRHELQGVSLAGKVVVFPGAKGASGWSGQFHIARVNGAQPAAFIFNKMNTKVALGMVVTRVPAVTDLDADPLSTIQTGDLLRVDGAAGTVEILERAADRVDPATIEGVPA
jgi:predicted aconitase with swiveling domain